MPHAPLTLTDDHALNLDSVRVNASALVNHDTITWASPAAYPAKMQVYHGETENHDVIVANGTPAERFVGAAERPMFDNHSDYLALYGAARLIAESAVPRVPAARLLSTGLRARLGIGDAAAPSDTRAAKRA